jgi:hypothetical protein
MGVTAVKDPMEDCYSDRPREKMSCPVLDKSLVIKSSLGWE